MGFLELRSKMHLGRDTVMILTYVRVAVFEILSDKKRKILQELEIWMKAEKQFPFTLNLHDLADTTEEYYAQALELRQGSAPEGDKVPKAFGDAKYHLGILGLSQATSCGS